MAQRRKERAAAEAQQARHSAPHCPTAPLRHCTTAPLRHRASAPPAPSTPPPLCPVCPPCPSVPLPLTSAPPPHLRLRTPAPLHPCRSSTRFARRSRRSARECSRRHCATPPRPRSSSRPSSNLTLTLTLTLIPTPPLPLTPNPNPNPNPHQVLKAFILGFLARRERSRLARKRVTFLREFTQDITGHLLTLVVHFQRRVRRWLSNNDLALSCYDDHRLYLHSQRPSPTPNHAREKPNLHPDH